jgi:Domain of unknown function (DUF5615)
LLRDRGHDVLAIVDRRDPAGRSDRVILEIAAAEDRAVITNNGIGSSTRRMGDYTLGAFVHANRGLAHQPTIAGLPSGNAIAIVSASTRS